MEESSTNVDWSNLSVEPCTFQEEEIKPISIAPPLSVSEPSEPSEPLDFPDFTDTFTTAEVFKTRDALFKWVRDVGKTVGTVIVVARSDYNRKGRTPTVNFGCERGGKYKARPSKKVVDNKKRTRRTGTKMCECPFSLRARKLPVGDQWTVKVVCGTHNHPITEHFEGHSFVGRLTSDEQQILDEMTKAGVRPKEVLRAIKERDVQNASTLMTIYNARAQKRLIEKAGKSQMQMLLHMLCEQGYVEWHRTVSDSDMISDLFWAHPESIQLAKCFPTIFLMDCTYKTNKYKFPLLEIVGVTSTSKIFSVAFVYMEAENEDNYVWALQRMRSSLNPETLPSIIITDRELALMNAIKIVFPEARNFLCRDHISRNVLAKCKPMFETKEVWDKFITAWNALVLSSNEGEYETLLASLERDFSEKYLGAVLYVNDFWLTMYKECFVAAWTDKYMHFGNTTTNRVESTHAKLKKQLGTSQGSFSTIFPAIHALLELQHKDITASFQKSVHTLMHDYTGVLFKNLRGFVSIHALDIILGEDKRGESFGSDMNACGCVIRRTHGLPCGCEIAQYKREGSIIPLSRIHSHWKKLSSVPTPSSITEHDVFPDLLLFMKRFEEADDDLKISLRKRLRELTEPQSID